MNREATFVDRKRAERSYWELNMHPLRKLRESGPHTAADVEPLLADAVTFHSAQYWDYQTESAES